MNTIPLTQESTGCKSKVTYGWVIVFRWQLDEEFPFSMIPLAILKTDPGFPMDLITGPLTDAARTLKHKLECFAGNEFYSIFCKVQEGTYNNRYIICLLYTSPSPRDRQKSRMPSSA